MRVAEERRSKSIWISLSSGLVSRRTMGTALLSCSGSLRSDWRWRRSHSADRLLAGCLNAHAAGADFLRSVDLHQPNSRHQKVSRPSRPDPNADVNPTAPSPRLLPAAIWCRLVRHQYSMSRELPPATGGTMESGNFAIWFAVSECADCHGASSCTGCRPSA